MFIFTRQMIDLGELSAIQKGQRINTTLSKNQEEPRRQGKQPSRKTGSEFAPETHPTG